MLGDRAESHIIIIIITIIIRLSYVMFFLSAAKVEIPVPPARTLQLIDEKKQNSKLNEINVSGMKQVLKRWKC